MIKEIEKYKMYQLTKNTIILCNNSEIKYKLISEFADEINDIINIKTIVTYKPTSIYLIDNEQKFIVTTEAPFILKCNNPYDLWFCDMNNKNEIQLWSFVEFKEYKQIWDKGIEEVYKEVINGRFGCYEGYGR